MVVLWALAACEPSPWLPATWLRYTSMLVAAVLPINKRNDTNRVDKYQRGSRGRALPGGPTSGDCSSACMVLRILPTRMESAPGIDGPLCCPSMRQASADRAGCVGRAVRLPSLRQARIANRHRRFELAASRGSFRGRPGRVRGRNRCRLVGRAVQGPRTDRRFRFPEAPAGAVVLCR